MAGIKGTRRTFHLSLAFSLHQSCFLCVCVCTQIQADGKVGCELNDSLSKWKRAIYLWPFAFFVQLFLPYPTVSGSFNSACCFRLRVTVRRIHSLLTFISRIFQRKSPPSLLAGGNEWKIRAPLMVSLIARVKTLLVFWRVSFSSQRSKSGGSPVRQAHISCPLLSDSEVLGKQCWTNVSNLCPFNQWLLSGVIIFHRISRGEWRMRQKTLSRRDRGKKKCPEEGDSTLSRIIHISERWNWGPWSPQS